MIEYITKEQARDALLYLDDDLAFVPEDRIEEISNAWNDEIRRLPSADVAPIVHAENVANAHPSEEFKCSKCGTHLADYIELRKVDGVEDFYIYEFSDWNFCPKCGAAMSLDNILVKE